MTVLQAQIRGLVIEEKTKLPVPFASISYTINTKQQGMIADKQGKFTISAHAIKQLNVSCLGYKTKEIILDTMPSSLLIIELEEQDFYIQELLVTPQNNPAIRIIRQVLANKDRNNFKNYDNYSYRCYFKTSGDIQTAEKDTVDMKTEYNMALLLSETVTLCNKSGQTIEEKIIATRTSGMKSPVFGQISYTIFYKAISFYENSIRIFGESGSNNKMQTDYLSPLSDNCLSAYNFQLEEEYITANDTIFEIIYFPPKNKNFNALMGTMFISSNGYALSSIIARPYEKGLIEFKFKQTYQWVDGKWFPENLEEKIGFSQLRLDKKSDAYLAYFIATKIDSVSFDIPEKRKSNRIDRIYLDEKSLAGSDSIIENTRPLALSEKEIKAYHALDSLNDNGRIDMVMNALTKVDEGKVSLKKFDVDVARFYNSNRYENARFGLGLYTNEYLIKFLSIGGYIGYGTKDEKLKYGGSIEFLLNRLHDMKIKYSYQNSLKEAGQDLLDAAEFRNNYLRNTLSYRFDHCVENKIEANYHVLRPLKIKASLNMRNLTPLYDYAYKGRALQNYIADEIQFSLRYAFGERYSTLRNRRAIMSEGNPVFNIRYTRGINFLRTNALTYNKWEASMNVVAYNGRIGQSNLRIAGGYIDRSLPYSLLFTGEGSKRDFLSFLISNTFQTMQPYEFLSDKYAHVFYSHNFGTLLFKTKIFRPEFAIAYNAGWGKLNDASHHAIEFKTQNHFYQEAGLVINNILRFNYLNVVYIRLGIGGFLRIGYYKLDKFNDNFALKVTLNIAFTR
jgi:hypothetical protein